MEYICLNCLLDPHLRQSLPRKEQDCDCCEGPGPSVLLFNVALECDQVLDTHFVPTHQDQSVRLYGRSPTGLDLKDTLASLQVVTESALEQLAEDVQELWFDRDTGETKYSTDDDDEQPYFRIRSDLGSAISESWRQMQESLQHEARFLNPEASKVLDSVLGDIHADRTTEGSPVLVEAGPGTSFYRLYRARTFQAEGPLIEALEHPERLLGTPAQGTGPAGRMNAKGQPAFYGATAEAIAVAEVRPPVGAWVATAAFELTRPVKLLDLRNLGLVQMDRAISLFDPRSIEKAQRRDFLRQLVEQLVQPVMPESQDRDYLPTQVIADYLATHRHGPVDGIVYASVQTPQTDTSSPRDLAAEHVDGIRGFNVALFPRASRVKGTEGRQTNRASLWDWEDDGPGRYLAPEIAPIPGPTPRDLSDCPPFKTHQSRWPITLELVLDSIKVHEVTGVQVTTTNRQVIVRRHST